MHNPLHVVIYGPLQIQENLTCEEMTVQALDCKEQELCEKYSTRQSFVAKSWSEEVSWELSLMGVRVGHMKRIPTYV
jgi:hypothetical protein